VEGRSTAEDAEALLLTHQALHACRLKFPWQGRDWVFEAPPDEAFRGFLAGGSETWRDPAADLVRFGL